jgi:hypothetical protein
MTILTAIRDGLRRVGASPKLVVFLWLINFAVAIPLTMVMSDQIEASIGASLVHEKLRAGFDVDWYEEFAHAANDLGKTFSPAVIGIGPFLGNLQAWLEGSLFANYAGIAGLGLGYMVLWAFVLGGVLDRYARGQESLTAERFFSASGRYFLRFLLLMVFSWVFYFIVLALISPSLFSAIAGANRDTTVERTVFFLTAGAYAIVAWLLAVVNMAFDYAKIFTVLRDQRNMLVAAAQGFRFIFAHPLKTFGLYLVLGMAALAVLGLYALIAPGANQASAVGVIAVFVTGQVFLAIKLAIRLTFFGGQMALYEAMAGAAPPVSEDLNK